MDIVIFIVLLTIVFILFIAAEYLDVVLHIAAFGLLFILGVTILGGGITYKAGEQVNTTYTYAASPFNTSINASSMTRQNLYSSYTGGYSRIIGIVLCAVSVLSFILVYVHYGKKRGGPNG